LADGATYIRLGGHHVGPSRPTFNLWPPFVADAEIIFLPGGFFFLSFLDVYHTSTHCVALVRIYDAGLKRAARGSLKIQKSPKKSPSAQHRIILSGYVFATKARINNRKKTC